MRPIDHKRVQVLITLLFTALFFSGLWGQFKSDLPRQLYPSFVEYDLSKPEFDWDKHQSTQEDSNVTLQGRWAWGHCYAVAAQGQYAYIGNGATFQILDVSNPALPRLVGEIIAHDLIIDVFVTKNTAYVAAWNAGLRIIDITNPQMPIELSSYPERETVVVKVSQNYAYLLGASDLTILNIANPSQPYKVGNLRLGDLHTDIEIREPYAYITCELGAGVGAFAIIDVSRHDVPFLRDNFLTPDYAKAVAIKGDYAYVAQSVHGLHIFDISDPDTIKYVRGMGITGAAWDIVISDSLAYVATTDGLQVLDISMPTQPQAIGYVDTPFFSLSSAVVGDYCYIADFVNMVVVDVSSATNPQIVGQFETGYFAEAVAISGNYAYVAEGLAGLWILDISNPSRPQAIGHFKTSDYRYVKDVVVSKNFVYLAEQQNGIEIVDVSRPDTPILVTQLPTTGSIRKLLICEDKLFVAAGEDGLLIFDMTFPNNPKQFGHFDTKVYAEDVSVSGKVAYVADASGGLYIIDVSHPESPLLLGNYAPEGFVSLVAASENIVFIVYARRTGEMFIRILDTSDPRNPVELFSLPESAIAIDIQNHFLIITSPSRIMGIVKWKIKLIDIMNPFKPEEVAHYYVDSSLMAFHTLSNVGGGISTDGRFIYLAFGFNGLYILDASNITSVNANPSENKNGLVRGFKLFQNYPNPFNAETSMEYELSESGQVVMKVFNLAGSEVATLVNAKQIKGRHRISFDASHLPSGIYVYRLTVNNQTVAKKMLVAK